MHSVTEVRVNPHRGAHRDERTDRGIEEKEKALFFLLIRQCVLYVPRLNVIRPQDWHLKIYEANEEKGSLKSQVIVIQTCLSVELLTNLKHPSDSESNYKSQS